MWRPARLWCLGVFCGSVAWFTFTGHAGKANPEAVGAQQPPMRDRQLLVAKLHSPIRFAGFDDPKTTVQEAMDHLSQRYDIQFDVNEAAFQAENVKNVCAVEIARLPIPQLFNVSLDRTLRKVLSRFPVPATYLVRRDVLEITTVRAQRAEIWGKDYQGPYLPVVNTSFEKQPLSLALRELSEAAQFSVVVDARAGDKAQVPVTSSFLNTPLDTAVRMLADMAGLKVTLNDNVLYVTADARAAKLRPNPGAANGGGAAPVCGFDIGGGAGILGGGMGFGGGNPALYLPVKIGAFEKKPLADALKQVLDGTGLKLVIDTARTGDKARTAVTADVEDVPLETAIRVLADLADLKPVILDNVVYVTTKENARSLQKEQDRRSRDALRLLYGGAGPPAGKK